MKNLSILLLLSALMLTPVRMSAMMESSRSAEEKKSEGTNLDEEVTRETVREKNEAVIEESKEQGNPNFKPTGIIERTISASGEKTRSNQDKVSLNLPEESELLEKENLFDLGILEQRLQEAREVASDLNGKGPAMGETDLKSLFQEWSERYKRYQKAESDFSKQASNNNNIGGIEEQLIEKKLHDLVKASGKAVEVLKWNLNNFVENETRIDGFNNEATTGLSGVISQDQNLLSETRRSLEVESSSQMKSQEIEKKIVKSLDLFLKDQDLETHSGYAAFEKYFQDHEQQRSKYLQRNQVFQNANNRLTFLKNHEEETIAQSSGEALEQTFWGKTGRYITQFGQGMTAGGVAATVICPLLAPLSLSVAVAGSVTHQVGEGVTTANRIIGNQRIGEAEANRRLQEGATDHEEKKLSQERGRLGFSSKHFQEQRAEILAHEKEETLSLAKKLPNEGWRESSWEGWARSILTQHEGKGPSEEKVLQFLEESRVHRSWIIEQTVLAWKKNLQKSRDQFERLQRTQRRKILLAQLLYNEAMANKKAYQQQLEKIEINQGVSQQHLKILVENSDNFESKVSKVEEDKVSFEEKWKQDKRLENRNLDQGGLTYWEEQKRNLPGEKKVKEIERAVTDQELVLSNAKNEKSFLLDLAQVRLQADEEALQRYWPQYDSYSSYSLLEEEKKETSLSQPLRDISKPLLLQSDQIARGKRIRFQLLQDNAGDTRSSRNNNAEPLIIAPQEVIPSLKNVEEELLSWSEEEAIASIKRKAEREQSSNQSVSLHEKRWEARRILEKLLKTEKALKAAQECVTPLATYVKSHLSDKKDLETESIFSSAIKTVRGLSIFSKAPTLTSEQSTLSSENVPENLGQRLAQIQKRIKRKTEIWSDLVKESEELRQERVKEFSPNFQESLEESSWQKADRAALQARYEAEKKRTDALRLQEWDKKTAVWRAYQGEKGDLKKESKRKGYEKYGGVLRRWEQLKQEHQEKKYRFEDLLNEENKRGNLQEQPSFIYGHFAKINVVGERARLAYTVLNTVFPWQESVEKYKKKISSQALEDAFENRGNAEWEHRSFGREEVIESFKNQPEKNKNSLSFSWAQMIGKIDQEAFQLFKTKKEELDSIEKIWRETLWDRDQKAWNKAHQAALSFLENPSLWQQLSDKEKHDYNEAVDIQKEQELKELTQEEQELLSWSNLTLQEQEEYLFNCSLISSFLKEQHFLTRLFIHQSKRALQRDFAFDSEKIRLKKEQLQEAKVGDRRQERTDIAWCYEKAQRVGEKALEVINDKLLVHLFEKGATLFEWQAQAFQKAEEDQAAFYRKVRNILLGDSLVSPGALFSWKQFSVQEGKNNKSAALAWYCAALASLQESTALLAKNIPLADLYHQKATILNSTELTLPGIAWAYTHAFEWKQKAAKRIAQVSDQPLSQIDEKVFQGSNQKDQKVAQSFNQKAQKVARVFNQAAQLREHEIENLFAGKEEHANIFQKGAKALSSLTEWSAAFAYEQGLSKNKNKKAAKLWNQSGNAYEEQVKALLGSLSSDDHIAQHDQRLAAAWEKVAFHYALSASENDCLEFSSLAKQIAQLYERKVDFLKRGSYQEIALLEKQLHKKEEQLKNFEKTQKLSQLHKKEVSLAIGHLSEVEIEEPLTLSKVKEKAEEQSLLGHREAAAAYTEAAKAYTQSEEENNFLESGSISSEEKLFISQKRISKFRGIGEAYISSGKSYEKSLEQTFSPLKKIYRKIGKRYSHIGKALSEEDPKTIDRETRIISIEKEQAEMCTRVQKENSLSGHEKVALAYEEAAKLYEKAALALEARKEERALFYQKKAGVFGGERIWGIIGREGFDQAPESVADAYLRALEQRGLKREKLASLYEEMAQAYEKYAALLEANDQEALKKQKEVIKEKNRQLNEEQERILLAQLNQDLEYIALKNKENLFHERLEKLSQHSKGWEERASAKQENALTAPLPPLSLERLPLLLALKQKQKEEEKLSDLSKDLMSLFNSTLELFREGPRFIKWELQRLRDNQKIEQFKAKNADKKYMLWPKGLSWLEGTKEERQLRISALDNLWKKIEKSIKIDEELKKENQGFLTDVDENIDLAEERVVQIRRGLWDLKSPEREAARRHAAEAFDFFHQAISALEIGNSELASQQEELLWSSTDAYLHSRWEEEKRFWRCLEEERRILLKKVSPQEKRLSPKNNFKIFCDGKAFQAKDQHKNSEMLLWQEGSRFYDSLERVMQGLERDLSRPESSSLEGLEEYQEWLQENFEKPQQILHPWMENFNLTADSEQVDWIHRSFEARRFALEPAERTRQQQQETMGFSSSFYGHLAAAWEEVAQCYEQLLTSSHHAEQRTAATFQSFLEEVEMAREELFSLFSSEEKKDALTLENALKTIREKIKLLLSK